MGENQIFPAFHQTLVHDGWRAYNGFWCRYALCTVHHLRELTFIEEHLHQEWAREMKQVLLFGKEVADAACEEGLTQIPLLVVRAFRLVSLRVIRTGRAANPPPTRSAGKGAPKGNEATNLLRRFWKHRDAVLRFLSDLTVPFDYSQAERDVRMVKVQHNVSGCFRTFASAVTFARLRGYLSTLRKQELPLLDALVGAVQG